MNGITLNHQENKQALENSHLIDLTTHYPSSYIYRLEIIKLIFLSACCRIVQTVPLTDKIEVDDLLKKSEEDLNFYIYRNENQENQSHGLTFRNSKEWCYISLKSNKQQKFLVSNRIWEVGKQTKFYKASLLAAIRLSERALLDPTFHSYLARSDCAIFEIYCLKSHLYVPPSTREEKRFFDFFLITHKFEEVNESIRYLSCALFSKRTNENLNSLGEIFAIYRLQIGKTALRLKELEEIAKKQNTEDYTTFRLYGGSIGNEYFQLYTNKVIIPGLIQYFKEMEPHLKTWEEMKQFIEIVMNELANQRQKIGEATGSSNFEKLGMKMTPGHFLWDPVISYPAWYSHEMRKVKKLLLDAYDRLIAKTSKETVSLNDLLQEATNNQDFFVYPNTNSPEQLYTIPFKTSTNWCFFCPKNSEGATFEIEHQEWKVGNKCELNRKKLLESLDYSLEIEYLTGKSRREIVNKVNDKPLFLLICIHNRVNHHFPIEITEQTDSSKIIDIFTKIYELKKQFKVKLNKEQEKELKLILISFIIVFSCGTFYRRGQASIMEWQALYGIPGMFGYKARLSDEWADDKSGLRTKMGIDQRALSHEDEARFIEECMKHIILEPLEKFTLN